MRKLLKNIFIFSFFISNYICTMHSKNNFLLQPPEKIELKKEIKTPETISLCWEIKNDTCTFLFNSTTGIFIECILKELRMRYFHGDEPKNYAKKIKKDKDDYFIQEKLIVKNDVNPKNLTIKKLYEIIKTKKIIFYTGAGISAAAGIRTKKELESKLKISNMIDDPEAYDFAESEKVFKKFCKSLKNSQTTEAHKKLTKLAKWKKCKIVTENMDNLHQRTGIYPYYIIGKIFKKKIKNEWAEEIDTIICCGLRHDYTGFLSWYKEHNTNGSIVAIDTEKPSYLSNNDFLVKDDVQKVIPKICKFREELYNYN